MTSSRPSDFCPEIAGHYWAGEFGLPRAELFAQPLRLVPHAGALIGYDGVFALFREGAKVVSLPPERAERLRPLVAGLPLDFTPGDLGRVMQPFAAAIIGPAFTGYAERVPAPGHPARTLTADDAGDVALLQAACDEIEWQHGGGDVREHPSSGTYIDGQLVALAGYEIWGGVIAHISVVTHYGHRGRGLGSAVVAHLAAQAIGAGLLPQYRTLDANQPSMRIAELLGFVRYATSLAVRLTAR